MKSTKNLLLFYFINLIFIFVFIIGSIKTIQKVGLGPSHHILFNEKDEHIYVNYIIDNDLKSIFSKGDRVDEINDVKLSLSFCSS